MVLRSGIRKKPIPDPGVKKASDPGSGSATLPKCTGIASCAQEMRNHFLETSRGAALPRGAQDQFRGISVCIMDEASQCVEPEALIPLKFGFNKVINI